MIEKRSQEIQSRSFCYTICYMIFFLLFLVQIFFLLFLSKQISYKLSLFFFNKTRNHKTVINLLSIIFLPGTIIHELSHMFMAEFLFVKTANMEFMPKIQNDNTVKLGSVAIARCDPLRRFLIGIAPVIGGVGILSLVYYLFNKNIIGFDFKTFILFLISFEIGNTMFSSSKDMEGALGLLIATTVIGVILFIIGHQFSYLVLNFLYSSLNGMQIFFKIIDILLLFPILVDSFVILIFKIFPKNYY